MSREIGEGVNGANQRLLGGFHIHQNTNSNFSSAVFTYQTHFILTVLPVQANNCMFILFHEALNQCRQQQRKVLT